jgi:hypothetical protein
MSKSKASNANIKKNGKSSKHPYAIVKMKTRKTKTSISTAERTTSVLMMLARGPSRIRRDASAVCAEARAVLVQLQQQRRH